MTQKIHVEMHAVCHYVYRRRVVFFTSGKKIIYMALVTAVCKMEITFEYSRKITFCTSRGSRPTLTVL